MPDSGTGWLTFQQKQQSSHLNSTVAEEEEQKGRGSKVYDKLFILLEYASPKHLLTVLVWGAHGGIEIHQPGTDCSQITDHSGDQNAYITPLVWLSIYALIFSLY